MKQETHLQSISTQLTVSLVTIVTLVAITAVCFIYFFMNYYEKKALGKKADDTLAYLVGTLEMPIWNYSQEHIERISATVIQNELVVGLKITSDQDQQLYLFEKENMEKPIQRSARIFHEGLLLGVVEISLTNRFYVENRQKFIIVFLAVTAIILMSLIIVTRTLIRRLLQTPLDGLNRIVESYADGVYHMEGMTLPYREFKPFEQVLMRMGEQITRQFGQLKNAEDELRNATAELENRVLERTAELEARLRQFEEQMRKQS